MTKNTNFPIGPILLCILISFFLVLSACSQDTITAKVIEPAIEESDLADTLSLGLADPVKEEIIKEPETVREIRLEAPRPKVELEIQRIIKEKPKEKVQVVMILKNDEDIAKISKLIEESSGDVTGEYKVGDVISAEITAEKLEEISKDESIEEIALEKEYFAFLNESIPQISIDTIAWASNYTGKGVKIAILDTGIDTTHEMFGNRVILSHSFNAEGVNDLNGHGSHCAGIAAGDGRYKGAAPDASLLNAKVLTSRGSGTTSNIIAGINWALDPDDDENTDDGADIISMSFGGALTDLDGPLASTIKDAINQGVIFVAASGNCRQGCGGFFGVTMPGSMPEVITVGAVDENNNAASFSSGDTFTNYIKPDITAPGVNIMSATKNGGYKSSSGTSMSTPMVAGLIALMLEKESLTHAQIKAKLESTAIDLGSSGKDIAYGSGLVNVSGLFNVTVTTNVTINETNTTINQTNSSDNETETEQSNETGNNTADDNDKENYEITYLTIPINYSSASLESTAQETTESNETDEYEQESAQSELKIAIKKNSTFYVLPENISSLGIQETEQEYQTTASGNGVIDYDDDYTHSTGTSDDGIAWRYEYLDVGLDSEEWDTMVICFDWTDDGNWDHCFADNDDDFDDCTAVSSSLRSICSSSSRCVSGDMDYDHVISTNNIGKEYVDARYYRDCDGSYQYVDISSQKFYIVKPRQYKCTSQQSGGTYYDGGQFASTTWYNFETSKSCSSGWGCDESKDDSNADFGTDGDNTPSAPCSVKDGYGDCDNDNECMPNSHCSCIGGCSWGTSTDYCCPSGKEWINNQCTTCDSCSSTGSRKRTGNTVYECKDYGNFKCWDSISNLGDSDFCDKLTSFSQTCGHGEYDCDSNSECGTNLICKGPFGPTGDDGCCYSNEDWDTNSNTCKSKDGQSCSSDSNCYSGHCVHSVCRSSDPYCGDTYCDNGESYDSCSADCNPALGHKDYCNWKGTCSHNEYDCDWDSECGTNLYCKGPTGDWSSSYYDGCCYSNENWDTSSKSCKKQNGAACSSGSECSGGHCVHNICRSSSTYCGDNYCDSGENYDSCSADCNPTLGHKDYCQWKGTCSHNEYDCDSNSECGTNLICTGPMGDWNSMDYDGCCYSYESWDANAKTCKRSNGQSCSSGSQCLSGFCVHSICRPSDPYPGDGHCDTNKGETCANSPNDCKKCNGAFCLQGVECQGGHCVHNACWNAPYKKNDGFCDQGAGESQSNSPGDCFGKLTVLSVTQWPTSVNQGQSFTVKARLQNQGTIAHTLNLEAGLVPSNWYNLVISNFSAQNFSTQAYWPTTKCCPGNGYFDAVTITLQPQQQQDVTFNMVAPTIHDVDSCDTANPKKSAWGSQHTLVVGLYNACGQAYFNYKAKSVHVNDRFCYRDSTCWQNEECDFSNGVPGVCAVESCTNECSGSGSYFCEGNAIKQCTDLNSDGCLEPKHIAYCTGNLECQNGQSTCQSMTPQTRLKVDYSDGNTLINKQPGDLVLLQLDYVRDETIELDYDSNAFTLSGCSNSFTITADKTCTLTVKDDYGTHSVGIKNGPKATVKTIRDPKIVFLTDRQKLITRFGHEDEVDSLLEQTYRTAEDDGIVYDLGLYLTGHPWSTLGGYSFSSNANDITENYYSKDVSEFAQLKCGNCKDIVLVGDDFVIPYFRRDVTFDTGIYTSYDSRIYTDSGYIRRSNIPFSQSQEMFYKKINGDYHKGKSFKFIVPRNPSSNLTNRIQTLERILEDSNPYGAHVDTYITGSNIDCTDKSLFDNWGGHSIILFGTPANNDAFKCFPFMHHEDSISTERNPWSKTEHAILLHTNDPFVVGNFAYLVKENKLDAESETMYYVKLSVKTIKYVGIGVSIAVLAAETGGLAVPAVISQIGAAAAITAGGMQSVDECILDHQSNLRCGASIGLTAGAAILTYAPLLRTEQAAASIYNPSTSMTATFDANTNTLSYGYTTLIDDGFAAESIAASQIRHANTITISTADDVVRFYQEVPRVVSRVGSTKNVLTYTVDDLAKLNFIDDLAQARLITPQLADDILLNLNGAKGVETTLYKAVRLNADDALQELKGALATSDDGVSITHMETNFHQSINGGAGNIKIQFDSLGQRGTKLIAIESKSVDVSHQGFNAQNWINNKIIDKINNKLIPNLNNPMITQTGESFYLNQFDEIIFTIPESSLQATVSGGKTFQQLIEQSITSQVGTQPFTIKIIGVP